VRLEVHCPHCNGRLVLPKASYVAVRAKCPFCSGEFYYRPSQTSRSSTPTPRARDAAPSDALADGEAPGSGSLGHFFTWLVLGGLALGALGAVVLGILLLGAFEARRTGIPHPGARQPAPPVAEKNGQPAHGTPLAPRLPPLTPKEFPGLPERWKLLPDALDVVWGPVAGERWIYDLSLESAVQLVPLDLGPTAASVLTVENHLQAELELTFIQRDASGRLHFDLTVCRLMGKLKGPYGWMEYDSKDPAFVRVDSLPYASLLHKTWRVKVWEDGSGALYELLNKKAPDLPDPPADELEDLSPIVPLPGKQCKPGEAVQRARETQDYSGREILAYVGVTSRAGSDQYLCVRASDRASVDPRTTPWRGKLREVIWYEPNLRVVTAVKTTWDGPARGIRGAFGSKPPQMGYFRTIVLRHFR
jgi:hypothetical protein